MIRTAHHRAAVTLLCMYLFVLALCGIAKSATSTVLHKREHRQVHKLYHYTHTLIFFRHHPHQARTRIGRNEIRRARVWVRVLRRELAETRSVLRVRALPQDVQGIIVYVFGPYASQALRVSSCESGFRTWAANGQYHGIFQMGSTERSTYGDGSDAWSQARAAYRYFVASGKDWSPWECKP